MTCHLPPKLLVCTQLRHAPNPHSCGLVGSHVLAERLEREIRNSRLEITVEQSACMGMCQNGPNVRLLPDGKNWHRVGMQDVGSILDFLRNREK